MRMQVQSDPLGLSCPAMAARAPWGAAPPIAAEKNGETGRLLQHLVSKLTLVSLSVKRKVGKGTPAGEQGGPPGGRGAPVSAGYAAGRCLPALCQWGGYRQGKGKAPGQAVTLLRRFSVCSYHPGRTAASGTWGLTQRGGEDAPCKALAVVQALAQGDGFPPGIEPPQFLKRKTRFSACLWWWT